MSEAIYAELEQFIRSHGAKNVRMIDPRLVVTGEWVRLKCQFGCARYGKYHTCPPYSPRPEETRRLLDGYSVGLLIHWGSRFPGYAIFFEIERRAFRLGLHKAFGLASGPCDLCEECEVEEPCRQPNRARPSMEACGIDVFFTARSEGLPIEFIESRDDAPNFYSLLLVE